jgi:predicted DNA-binding protein
MRDKLHIEEVKVRLTEGDKTRLEHLSRARGIPPAVLARTLIKQYLQEVAYRAVSIQTGNHKGSPLEGLGEFNNGTQSTA